MQIIRFLELKFAEHWWIGKKQMGVHFLMKKKDEADPVIATVFWDISEIMYVDFFHKRTTVNAAYYDELLDKVKAA